MAGGAYIRIKNGNIEIHAPGKVEQKGAVHSFMGPASMVYPMPSFIQETVCIECLKNATKTGTRLLDVN